jgi:hypothetical protein
LENASALNGRSTLTPKIFALAEESLPRLSLNVHISFSQTPVNAAGKNARMTDWPLYELNLCGVNVLSTKVKSGAEFPTDNAIKTSIKSVNNDAKYYKDENF